MSCDMSHNYWILYPDLFSVLGRWENISIICQWLSRSCHESCKPEARVCLSCHRFLANFVMSFNYITAKLDSIKYPEGQNLRQIETNYGFVTFLHENYMRYLINTVLRQIETRKDLWL